MPAFPHLPFPYKIRNTYKQDGKTGYEYTLPRIRTASPTLKPDGGALPIYPVPAFSFFSRSKARRPTKYPKASRETPLPKTDTLPIPSLLSDTEAPWRPPLVCTLHDFFYYKRNIPTLPYDFFIANIISLQKFLSSMTYM